MGAAIWGNTRRAETLWGPCERVHVHRCVCLGGQWRDMGTPWTIRSNPMKGTVRRVEKAHGSFFSFFQLFYAEIILE